MPDLTISADTTLLSCLDREDMLSYIDNYVEVGYTNYLILERTDCGCVHTYVNREDVPATDVVCEHSNQIIKYS